MLLYINFKEIAIVLCKKSEKSWQMGENVENFLTQKSGQCFIIMLSHPGRDRLQKSLLRYKGQDERLLQEE